MKTHVQSCGPMGGGLLTCSHFGFTYRVPFGWVDRTGDMQRSDADASAGELKDDAGSASANGAEALLAAFERPPGAPGETINSAVVIAAEGQVNYHGVKTAADYFGPIAELAERRGFKVVNEPHKFSSGEKQLVRGDFSKQRGKLTMWQSWLVMIEKGYIVSFTFVGGSEDEVDGLIRKLTFTARNR